MKEKGYKGLETELLNRSHSPPIPRLLLPTSHSLPVVRLWHCERTLNSCRLRLHRVLASNHKPTEINTGVNGVQNVLWSNLSHHIRGSRKRTWLRGICSVNPFWGVQGSSEGPPTHMSINHCAKTRILKTTWKENSRFLSYCEQLVHECCSFWKKNNLIILN